MQILLMSMIKADLNPRLWPMQPLPPLSQVSQEVYIPNKNMNSSMITICYRPLLVRRKPHYI